MIKKRKENYHLMNLYLHYIYKYSIYYAANVVNNCIQILLLAKISYNLIEFLINLVWFSPERAAKFFTESKTKWNTNEVLEPNRFETQTITK